MIKIKNPEPHGSGFCLLEFRLKRKHHAAVAATNYLLEKF